MQHRHINKYSHILGAFEICYSSLCTQFYIKDHITIDIKKYKESVTDDRLRLEACTNDATVQLCFYKCGFQNRLFTELCVQFQECGQITVAKWRLMCKYSKSSREQRVGSQTFWDEL